MALTRAQFVTLGAATTAAALTGRRSARAADARHYSFGYDQPHTTAYGVGADLFAARLAELSKGTMVIDQFPGAQLGQEPQMLQKIRTGDIDFMFSSIGQCGDAVAAIGRAVDPLPVPLRGPSGARASPRRRWSRRCATCSPRR